MYHLVVTASTAAGEANVSDAITIVTADDGRAFYERIMIIELIALAL